MKHLLLFAALSAALPAAAQFLDPTKVAEIDAATQKARSLAERLKPAPVDPATVSAIGDRLSKDGSQIEMEEGTRGNVLQRQGPPDARGRFRSIEANLVELPPEAVEAPSGAMFRDLVARRYFSHLEATSDDWIVDPKTGYGQVHEWHYTISLDGKLLAVEHTIAPVAPVGPDESEPQLDQARSYRLSPSDPYVQKRWKKLSKELLTLGRTVQA